MARDALAVVCQAGGRSCLQTPRVCSGRVAVVTAAPGLQRWKAANMGQQEPNPGGWQKALIVSWSPGMRAEDVRDEAMLLIGGRCFLQTHGKQQQALLRPGTLLLPPCSPCPHPLGCVRVWRWGDTSQARFHCPPRQSQTMAITPGMRQRNKPVLLHFLRSAASSKNSSNHLCFPQLLCLFSIANWVSYFEKYFHGTAEPCGAGFDAVLPHSFLLKG